MEKHSFTGTDKLDSGGRIGEVSLKEITLFYILVVLAVFFVYHMPGKMLLFFAGLLVWAAVSRKYYFWLAFFFLIIQEPGHFFRTVETSRIAAITLGSGISFSVVDVFTAILLVKYITNRKSSSFRLKSALFLLFAYYGFSLIRGSMFYSSSLDTPLGLARMLFSYSWIFFFLAFVRDWETVKKFIKLLLPITFFILFTQVYLVISEREFITLFDPYARPVLYNEVTGEIRPFVGEFLILFFNFLGASLLVRGEKGARGKTYLYAIIASCFLSVFLSASRIWFVLFSFVGFWVYGKRLKDLPRLAKLVTSALMLLFFLIMLGVISLEHLQYSSWGRISELGQFFGGNAAEITTLGSRLVRLERTWSYFVQSPVFGYGFSEFMLDNWEGHWGFFSTLYELGIVGLVLVLIIIVRYLNTMITAMRRVKSGPLKESLSVLYGGFLGMLLLYATNWNPFSPIHIIRITFLMVFFAISEILVRRSLEQGGYNEINP